MPLRRVVVPSLSLKQAQAGDIFTLPPDYAHYLRRVLRVEDGAQIELCDGAGSRWCATLRGSAEGLEAMLAKPLPPGQPLFPIFLAQGMPKADRFEQVLQRSTELGVSGFYPMFSARCVVQLTPHRQPKKMARWQRIIQEAGRQCQRSRLPILFEPMTLPQILDALPPELCRIVCWEGAHEQALKTWIKAHPSPAGVVVFVGPEGGFTPEEISLMAKAGVEPVGLGPLILRTETAGPAVSAVLQFAYGHFGDVVP